MSLYTSWVTCPIFHLLYSSYLFPLFSSVKHLYMTGLSTFETTPSLSSVVRTLPLCCIWTCAVRTGAIPWARRHRLPAFDFTWVFVWVFISQINESGRVCTPSLQLVVWASGANTSLRKSSHSFSSSWKLHSLLTSSCISFTWWHRSSTSTTHPVALNRGPRQPLHPQTWRLPAKRFRLPQSSNIEIKASKLFCSRSTARAH